MRDKLVKLKYWFVGLAAISLYIWGAQHQSHFINTDRDAYDQSAYMNYSKELVASDYNYVGGRNRMPLYPMFMSILYDEEMSDQTLFERGKNAGIISALLVTLIAFLIFRKDASFEFALVPSLIALLSVFAFKAPYFQTETIFYGFSFLLFVLIYRLIQNPNWILAITTGSIAGLGHLTKASVLPCLLLGVFWILISSAIRWKNRETAKPQKNNFDWKHSGVLCALLIGSTYLAVIFPYINNSKEMTGHYFYNVNSTFYMWYDSWDEAKEGTRAYNDRFSWPDMPADEIPSPLKYLQEHSLSQISLRYLTGAIQTLGVGFVTYGYSYFILIYSLLIGGIISANSARIRSQINLRSLATIGFISSYFAAYFSLYAWYAPIAIGNRFILSLFLPVLYVITRTLKDLQDHNMEMTLVRRKITSTTVNKTLLYALIIYSITLLPFLVSRIDGGH